MAIRERHVLANWAFAAIDDIVVFCAREKVEPVEADVAGWLAYLRRERPTKILLHSLGAAPNAAQRKRISAEFVNREPPRILLLTSSRAVRFVAEAFRWMVKYDIKMLAPEQLSEGLEWLGFAGSRADVALLIDELHAELAGRPPLGGGRSDRGEAPISRPVRSRD